jgi:hypothetical protein
MAGNQWRFKPAKIFSFWVLYFFYLAEIHKQI